MVTRAPSAAPLVALQSFVGRLGGADVTFKAGDQVAAGHPAAKKWPHLFGPIARDSGPRVEQATAAPGEKRGA